MTIEWVYPEWLSALALIPLFLVWTRRRAPAAIRMPRAALLAAGASRSMRMLAALPDVLRVLALTALILSLARPRSARASVDDAAEGVPMIVAIDISSSMLAQDFLPRDRLEVAKSTIARFIARRENDPIGLVAFAAEAITLVPITTYQPILLDALASLRVGLLDDGTAIGDGLATAVNRLRRLEASDRVIILMSDGESNRGEVDPLAAAQAAAAFGIRVHTIGVGSEGVARVPVGRAPSGFQYAERPVRIDEGTMRRIAAITGGQYFRATDPGALERIYDEIDRLVKAPVEIRRFIEYREWYSWLLLLAATALCAEVLLRGSRWAALP